MPVSASLVGMSRTTGLLVVTLMSVSMTTGHIVSSYDYDYVSCRESRIRCLDDPDCKDLLYQIVELCGESVNVCPPASKSGCRNLLSSLQIHPFFRACSCNQLEPEARECFSIQNTIFLHTCVSREGEDPNISWMQPNPQLRKQQQQQQQPISGDQLDDEDPDSIDGVSDEDRRDLTSCIGVRTQCLRDRRCSGLLTAYRNLCRENKKQNECVATDWQGCYRTMNSLRTIKPELFDCACPMKKRDTKDRCDRIQWRIANNTCLVTIPYLIHTLPYPDLSYEELEDAAYKESNNNNDGHPGGSCPAAFEDCHSDTNCRMRLTRVVSECSLDNYDTSQSPKNYTRCDRKACHDAIRGFMIVQPERTRSLLFCRCGFDDERCEMLRRTLTPPCSVVEIPPPSCLGLVDKCLNDSDCRLRWKNFDRYCYWNQTTNACHSGPEMCRSSIVGVAGTDLTINCTCALTDEVQQRRCEDLRSRLRQSNKCIDMAIEHFHQLQSSRTTLTTTTKTTTKTTTTTTTTTSSTTKTMSTTTMATDRNLVEYSSDGSSQSDTSQTFPVFSDCGRYFGQKIPSFMTTPEVLRLYTNHSDCSEVCQCQRNRSVSCKTLPCSPNHSCKLKDKIYDHGTAFLFDERGPCRCIKGETVCAKPHIRIEPSQGVFLHLGYSKSDQYLIETSTGLRFNIESITSKLSTILNEDSAEQFCRLELHKEFEGNLVFRIEVSKFSPSKHSNGIESCLPPAYTLSTWITNRILAIISDAELSVIKVASVERVKFHEPLSTPSEWKEDELTRSTSSHSSFYWSRSDKRFQILSRCVFSLSVTRIILLTLNLGPQKRDQTFEFTFL